MLINSIIKKLEQVDATPLKFTAVEAQWGGWTIWATSRIGRYYDLQIIEQVTKTDEVQTVEQAIEKMKQQKISAYGVKPWHDEDDLQSDYHAYNYNYKVNGIEKYAEWAKDETRRHAPELAA